MVFIMSLFFLQVLQGDRRLGLRHGNTGHGPGSAALDEPMDTIFVKNVRENSSADVAGLATGKLLRCFLIYYLICPHNLAEYIFYSMKSVYNWKTEEILATAVVTLETERIKGSNP